MKASKTKIDRKLEKKTSPELVETILKLKKNDFWTQVANMISGPTRKQASLNLDQIDRNTKEGDTILVPGKILGQGEVTKKIRAVALYFSASAIVKLKDKKCEIVNILEEFKVNPKFQGVKILR
ncbi:MAG: 50S ribosomal protein L18e [archaeon]